MSDLTDFTTALFTMYEKKHEEEKLAAEELKGKLETYKESIKDLGNLELITQYDEVLNGGYSSPVIMRVLALYKEAVKAEIIRRMEDVLNAKA